MKNKNMIILIDTDKAFDNTLHDKNTKTRNKR